jgi:hypothetical protein
VTDADPDEPLALAAAAVDHVAARSAYALADDELRNTLAGLQDIATRVTAVMAALAREASGRDLPSRDGAASTVSWLRDLLRINPSDAGRIVALGAVITARPALAAAIGSGAANPAQALTIGRVLDDVPSDDPATVDKVETILLDHATRFEPAILARLGVRVLAHVNPDLADQKLREKLERETRSARQRRGLTLSSDGLGRTRLSGVLDAEGAAVVAAAIEPLARPVRDDNGLDPRTAATRRADALVEVCRLAMASGELPDNGGLPPQLNVTVDFDALAREVAVGQSDAGACLAPSVVRRLACDAQVLPVVLDGVGVPIDIGRARRTYTGAARSAVVLRDGGCAFPGCDRPSRWTEIHHITFWANGGPTDRDNGVALCSFHHRRIHHGDWQVRMGSDKRPEFIPPAHIDPGRRPRRNPYHQRE